MEGRANGETNQEGEWCLEWAIGGKYRHRDDWGVKEDFKRGEYDRRNRTVDLSEVPREPKPQSASIPMSFLSCTLLLSAVDPRVSFYPYRLSHCFPSVVRNDVGRVADTAQKMH